MNSTKHRNSRFDAIDLAPAARPQHTPARPSSGSFSFLTNYALLLVYVVQHPESTVRTISTGVGITERAALSILRDLDDEGIVERQRNGRCNTYSVNFLRLAGLRRGGTASPLTPRPFVDVVTRTLFQIAYEAGTTASATPPEPVSDGASEARSGSWGFFTNHLLILLAIARDSTRTVRELAISAGITERASVAILNQLEDARIISRFREGRRNSYTIDFEAFRSFSGWSNDHWRIPASLIDVATAGIRALSAAK